MTLIIRPHPTIGLTRWGVFHNIGDDEETGYIYLHIAGRQIGLLWAR